MSSGSPRRDAAASGSAPEERPPVSVVVPFLGSAPEAGELIERLGRLRTRPGDELIIADNCPEPVVPEGSVRVVRAEALRSSYHARNVGAEAARGEWLLFLDADVRPRPDLLDRYLDPQPDAGVGILAGEVDSVSDQADLAARHRRSRGHLAVEPLLASHPHPTGVTANLMVRRRTWAEIGGFFEVRSGGDMELCFRAQEAGWKLAYRPGARVEHFHIAGLGAMRRKARFYGPGQAWLERRYPGSAPPPRTLRILGRALAGTIAWLLVLRFERAAFKALDGVWTVAYVRGYYAGDNRPAPARAPEGPPDELLLAGAFADADDPAASEAAARLAAEGRQVAVLAGCRPLRLDREALAGIRVRWVEDVPAAERVRALLRLALQHPLRLARARRARPRPGVGGLAAAAHGRAAAPRLGAGGAGLHDAGWPEGARALGALLGAGRGPGEG